MKAQEVMDIIRDTWMTGNTKPVFINTITDKYTRQVLFVSIHDYADMDILIHKFDPVLVVGLEDWRDYRRKAMDAMSSSDIGAVLDLPKEEESENGR